MRKLLYTIIPLIPAIIFLSSCSGYENEPESLQGGHQDKAASIIISARSAPDTKTAISRDANTSTYSVRFTAGDTLAVFAGEASPRTFGIKGSVADDGSADFIGEIPEGCTSDIIALYPYQENATASLSEGTIKAQLPYQQTAVPNSFDPSANLSIGVCAEDPGDARHFSLELKNVCSLVKFTIPDGLSISKAVLSSNGSEHLAGDIVITPGTAPAFTVSSGRTSVELTGEDLKGTYYLPVLPGTLSGGFTIRLYCKDLDRAVAEISTSKTVNLKRSTILNLGTLNCKNTGDFAGNGTDEDPYIITSFEQLRMLELLINTGRRDEEQGKGSNLLQAHYQAASYYLAADIDCNRADFGIGFNSPADGCLRFKGHFNGGGHCISNYFLNSGSDASLGLFRYAQGATIENLTISPYSDIHTHNNGVQELGLEQIGLLVGHVYSRYSDEVTVIKNCHSKPVQYCPCSDEGTLAIGNIGVSGLVGKVQGNLKISDCTNEAKLSIVQKNDKTCLVNAGGIVGLICFNDYFHITCEIDRCRNKGNIYMDTSSWERTAGGILGCEADFINANDVVVSVTNCVNSGEVYLNGGSDSWISGVDSFAGGIVGHNASDGVDSAEPYIFNCLNTGKIYSFGNDAACGGIVGFNFSGDTRIALCVNTGQIVCEGDPHYGAISGQSDGAHQRADCIECFWTNDSSMYSTGDGGCATCNYKKPLDASFLNGRKSHVNDNSTSQWSNAQWAASAEWVGGIAADGTGSLDLELND